MHIDVVFLTKLMDILMGAIAAPFADEFSNVRVGLEVYFFSFWFWTEWA